jgi:ABC-2 type transport system permease protein
MRTSATLATAARIVRQLGHDRRSVALLLVVPSTLLTLVYSMFHGEPGRFDDIGLTLLAVFPFLTMFLVTSVSMLRERTSGTLERLFTMPIGKLDLLVGYAAAFSGAAVLQAAIAGGIAYWCLGLDTAGSPALVILIAVVTAVLGVALGLLCSAFARTEFQAVQFLPVVVLPQLLLCGLFVPNAQMASWLGHVANVLPLTYAVDALGEVGTSSHATAVMWRDLGVVVAFALGALAAGAATLRRRS